MANNYSQQYYGLPFQYPPPQQTPNAPPDAPGGHTQYPDMHHAPALSPFALPGLGPPAPSPGANHMSFGHNSQQPAYTQAAWPPHDPNAWFALMQTAMASGQPPPLLPGFALPPSFPPLQTPQLAHAQPPPPPAQRPLPVSDRVHEVMESDREDGEVSEGELPPHHAAAKANGRAPAQPPRSVPQAEPSPRAQEAYNPDQPAAGQRMLKKPVHKPSRPAPAQNPVDALQQNRDQAKHFVKLLHSNNIGYRTLAKEPLDLEQLRGLYQSLNLPSEPAPLLPPKPPAQAEQHMPAPTLKTDVAASAAKSAPSPTDRKDYVARLQAAKLAKANAPRPSPPQNTPPAIAAPPSPSSILVQTAPAATIAAKPANAEEEKAQQKEKLRHRLEIMKAKNAKARAESSKALTPSGTTTPSNQAYKPPFPGIPGLFMNPPPSYHDTSPKPLPVAPQKRPAPVDATALSTPRGSVTPYTRQSGDSPRTYQDEPMLIEGSEDESNGSDMDIDDDQAPLDSAVASPSTVQQRQGPGTLPNFPPRTVSTHLASSAVSSPGPQTPSNQGRDQELKTKEDQLAAMRLTLKKKLAEKREKDRAAAAAAAATSSAASQSSSIPAAATQNGASPQPIVPLSFPMALRDVMQDSSELTRDVKRRRREEIQSKLPSFDAELAANAERMAQILKEMELLKAHNQKVIGDKERLTRELEGLGVDTEGMSHAEMRAKKNEIDHEKLPDSEAGVDHASSLAASAPIEPSSMPTAEPVHDGAGNAQPLDLLSLPDRDEVVDEPAVADEQAVLSGLALGSRQGVGYGTASSRASTFDETHPPEANSKTPHLQPASPQHALQLEEAPIAPVAPPLQDTATPLDEEDDFYSPAPADAPIVDESMDLDNTLQAQVAAEAGSLSEEGEVEMSMASDDEEEEYEPEEPTIVADAPIQNIHTSDLAVEQSAGSGALSAEDEEAYEPPDVDEELQDVGAEDIAASARDVSEPEVEAEAEDGAMDIASSSSEDSDSDPESGLDGEITSGNEEFISINHGPQQAANVADDLAQELQPESAPAAVTAEDDELEQPKFTPYESPLRMFKSYRYHPNFAQDVSGGFLSPTFSHQIDPERPFCPYETAGGSCNDPECFNQHFRGMGITGETLLVQLGTANPGKSPEEKQMWNDGLRGVLKELRKKSIKDPNGIAAEIAKYRRQFLNDDTRVINL